MNASTGRNLAFATVACAVSVAGCGKTPVVKLEDTNAFDRFKVVENAMLIVDSPMSKECEIPRSQLPRLEAIIGRGVRDHSPILREVDAHLFFAADGQKHRWQLYGMSADTYLMVISDDECWRVNRRDILKFLADCNAASVPAIPPPAPAK